MGEWVGNVVHITAEGVWSKRLCFVTKPSSAVEAIPDDSAKRLKDALRVEQLLTGAELDYLVESDQYAVSPIFRRPPRSTKPECLTSPPSMAWRSRCEPSTGSARSRLNAPIPM